MGNKQSTQPSMTSSSSETVDPNSGGQPACDKSSNDGPTHVEVQKTPPASPVQELANMLSTVELNVNADEEQPETDQVLKSCLGSVMGNKQSTLPSMTSSSSGTADTISGGQPAHDESLNNGPTHVEVQNTPPSSPVQELPSMTVELNVNADEEQPKTDQVLKSCLGSDIGNKQSTLPSMIFSSSETIDTTFVEQPACDEFSNDGPTHVEVQKTPPTSPIQELANMLSTVELNVNADEEQRGTDQVLENCLGSDIGNKQSTQPSMTSSSSGTVDTNSGGQPAHDESLNDGPTHVEVQKTPPTSPVKELTNILSTVELNVNADEEQRKTDQVLQSNEVSQEHVIAIPNKLLIDGNEIPIIGYEFDGYFTEEIRQLVKFVLDAGYRHLNFGLGAYNAPKIGEVLSEVFAEGKIKREDLYITSELWTTHHSYQRAGENIDSMLEEFQLDYLDLVLINWPQGKKGEAGDTHFRGDVFSDDDYLDTWKALEDAKMAGKVKSIGLAHFNHKQIERVWDVARIKPAVLNIEMHPLLTQIKLRAFCAAKNIVITANRPFRNFVGATRIPRIRQPEYGRRIAVVDEAIGKVKAAHGKTAEQVTMKWLLQHDVIVLPSSYEEQLEENLELFDFQLSADEMSSIDGLNRNHRLLKAESDEMHPHYPFHEEY